MKMQDPSLIDLLPDYWQFWQAEEHLSAEQKVEQFRKAVIVPNQAIYKEAFRGYFGSITDDQSLLKYLSQAKPIVMDMNDLSATLPEKLKPYSLTFMQTFPDMQPFTIYLMPSLFTFNGKTGSIDGRRSMFVGIDWLAKHKHSNLGVLMDHELFHIYQHQVAPETFSEVSGKQSTEYLFVDRMVSRICKQGIKSRR